MPVKSLAVLPSKGHWKTKILTKTILLPTSFILVKKTYKMSVNKMLSECSEFILLAILKFTER